MAAQVDSEPVEDQVGPEKIQMLANGERQIYKKALTSCCRMHKSGVCDSAYDILIFVFNKPWRCPDNTSCARLERDMEHSTAERLAISELAMTIIHLLFC